MEERNPQYELQTSRNGLPVPVINGIYLHSIYNPVKEAQALIQNFENSLKNKNVVLVLGLGFGYHIEEAFKVLQSNHESFQIIVLESNSELVNDFIAHNQDLDERIQIISTESAAQLFESWDFVQFLMAKPCIIKHDASFTLQKKYFTDFLAHQASKKTRTFSNLLNVHAQDSLKNTENILAREDANTLGDIVEGIKARGSMRSKSDYLFMAFNEIVNSDFQGK